MNLILGGFGVAALLLSVTLLGDALTRFGTTHWQTRGEMKRNGFFCQAGRRLPSRQARPSEIEAPLPRLERPSRMR